jgi:hypothetical protein
MIVATSETVNGADFLLNGGKSNSVITATQEIRAYALMTGISFRFPARRTLSGHFWTFWGRFRVTFWRFFPLDFRQSFPDAARRQSENTCRILGADFNAEILSNMKRQLFGTARQFDQVFPNPFIELDEFYECFEPVHDRNSRTEKPQLLERIKKTFAADFFDFAFRKPKSLAFLAENCHKLQRYILVISN